ncbi:OsmC family peroxiredoxin [bacterium]|nr:MAG: OsmC family peroxiredoxin [bacterium]
MSAEHSYNVNLNWLSDRKGVVSSPELNTSIEVVTPPDFPKGIAGIWSPEHLFVASVSSCLMTTFLAVAENSQFNFIEFSCDANGVVDRIEKRFMVTEITLKPRLVIESAEQEARAQRILEMSEKACLISNSITSTVHFQPEIIVKELA